mgnify:CR=1 FL=1
MATLFICVFEGAASVATGDPIQEEGVNIGATSTQSNAISGSGKKRRRVRLYADADCFVTWDSDPTATTDGTSGRPMGADNPEYWDIESGYKIAVIQRL